MPYTVKISGVEQFVLAGTLKIDSAVGRRSQLSCTIRTTTATHFQQDQTIQAYDANGKLAFNGYITDPKESKPGFQASLRHTITAADQHRLADKRRIAAGYSNKTCGFIVQDIVTNILSQEGVTVGQIFDGLTPSPTLYPNTNLFPGGNVGLIPAATFAYCTVAQALDALVKQASNSGVPYYWQIDQNKRLWFVPYDAVVNLAKVDGSAIDQKYHPVTVQRKNPTYRNVQYITGGVAQTVQQTETRIGDSHTTAWTMGYELALLPTITVDASTKSVGKKGSTGFDFYYAVGDSIITQDSGGTKLTSSNTLQVVYIGQYPNVIIAQNGAQVSYEASLDGTSGLVEDVVNDPSIATQAGGFTNASQLLARYAQQGVLLQFSTLQNNFAQGQLVTVNLPQHNLSNAQMLVESVTADDQTDGFNIWYRVSVVQGPYDVSWVSFFSALFAGQQPATSINVGVSQTVTILRSSFVQLSPMASLVVKSYSCPVVNTTLYPSLTLYPC